MPSKPKTFRSRQQPPAAVIARDYDQRRGSARERGYTADWDTSSAGFRSLHPLCLGCEAVGIVAATAVTDHVIPHKGNKRLFWESGNWQPGCGWHHDVVKQVLEGRYERGEIDASALRFDSPEAIALTRQLLIEAGRGLELAQVVEAVEQGKAQ